MTAIPQPTAIDGYRWLKNDIIRGVYQPDEKLRMSLLTSRYELGVGPLREALSQLVAERLVTVVNQKGYRVAPMSEQELLDIFDARANMEAMLVALAIERGDDAWEAEILARAHMLGKLEAIDASEQMLDEWDQRHQAFSLGNCRWLRLAVFAANARTTIRFGGALPVYLAAKNGAVGGDVGR
ncbi:DNA-binding transcriptional regulator CsiR [Citrobacter freundii]|nr:DNA-binding transcriptional regulator CsiR [Citrobacter freundii]